VFEGKRGREAAGVKGEAIGGGLELERRGKRKKKEGKGKSLP
jgi:hypothetical protein